MRELYRDSNGKESGNWMALNNITQPWTHGDSCTEVLSNGN